MAVRANSFGGVAVSHLFPAYCELISSPAQLARCQEATSVSELLAIIKDLWQQTALSDDQLLGELAQLNQQIIDSNQIHLAGHWLPYRYHAKTCSIHWCLPAGHATEPFQDEAISRYRQTILVNQFITPKTGLSVVDVQARSVQSITPAGFIFHLSRCGSTLISGCLSELDSTSVFSESPVLTEILLDQTLGEAAQQQYLQQLIDLQASVFPSRPHVVIKWNAWDIFRWDLIRAMYPQVPGIFLVRDPVEILASHQRSAGRHMSGDPSLAGLHSVFTTTVLAGQDVLDKRIRILHGLLQAMSEKSSNANISVINYQHVCTASLVSILKIFGCAVDRLGFLKIQERMQYHSKNPGQTFIADSVKKQHCFTPEEQERIRTQLTVIYNKLNQLAHKSLGMVIDVH